MKTKTMVMIIAVASGVVAAGQVTWAGPSSGGGGMVVTCRSKGKAITSTDLLDVYEAKQNPKLEVMRASGSFSEDYLRTVGNTYSLQGAPSLAESLKEEILKNLNEVMASVDWVESLPFLNDQGVLSVELPERCELEQLAIFYESTQRISINKEIWKRLDSLSRAALVQHEVFYHVERRFDEHTSESTRSYIRQIISMSGFTPVLSGAEYAVDMEFANDKENNVTAFYVHRTKNELGTEDLTLQFTHIGGRPVLVKTTVHVPNFILTAKCSFDRTANERICLPTIETNKQILLPVITKHRGDWEILLKYVTGQPISITLLQRGVPLSIANINWWDN